MTARPTLVSEQQQVLARACLVGGAVGDALGAPLEFLSLAEIRRRHGAAGVQDFTSGDWPAGSITDDTQMTLFTAEGLIRAAAREALEGTSDRPAVVAHAYLRWLTTQGIEPACPLPGGPPGLLLGVEALHRQRGPGQTCITALASLRRISGKPAVNDRKGCGGIMRIAPAGILCAGGGRADVAGAFTLGADLAALTHGHPSGSLAAGLFAAVIAQLMCGVALPDAVDAAAAELRGRPHHEETLVAVEGARYAARQVPATPETVEALGGGWVAEEALAIALYCALVAPSFDAGVMLAVNHGGDSDSTGALAGNLLGIVHGEQGIPARWLARLELRELIARVAEDLWACAEQGPAAFAPGTARASALRRDYPGC